MARNMPVRLGPAEDALISQLEGAGASATAERIRVAGLPTRRVESYHYTDLKTLLRDVPPLAGVVGEGAATPLAIAGAYSAALVNGVPQVEGTAPAGVTVERTSGPVLTTRDDVLVHLNSALLRDGLNLRIDGSELPVIHIDHRTEGHEAVHAVDGARIYVADGAKVTIIETFTGSDAAHLSNGATYLAVGRGAEVTHITVDLSARSARHFATVEYHLAEAARLRSLVVHAGADLARSQVFARFSGERAHADFTGLNLTENGQHLDITLDVSHAVAHTTSQELFKQLARGRSRAVFQGRIVVARDAQKTDAKMMMQGLMLSDEAEILSKPELEIYADDVVCGHGSTCGQLNDDWLFYLMSRGIPKAEAETILVRGFLAELIDPIDDETVREMLTGIVDGWLAGK